MDGKTKCLEQLGERTVELETPATTYLVHDLREGPIIVGRYRTTGENGQVFEWHSLQMCKLQASQGIKADACGSVDSDATEIGVYVAWRQRL
jgi:hypothetical protein